MSFCPNCGTEYEALPLRCQCGYIFSTSGASAAATPTVSAAAVAPAFSPLPQEGRFSFSGSGGDLLVLYIKLIVFSLFTLGIYNFWGRTAIRTYLWANIRLAGQPFAYHGTGKELLMGWLKLIGLVVAVVAASALMPFLLPGQEDLVAAVEAAVGLAAALGFLPLVLHGTIRYRLSRTSWQGRRFAYKGDMFELAKVFWIGALLSIVTLGILLPFLFTSLRKYAVENTWYGGHALSYNGDGQHLLWPWVKFLLLFLPTLGVYRFWFQSTMANYNWSKTSFAGAPLRSNYSGGGFFWLAFTNILLLVFTLGLAWPWTICRQMSYVFDNLIFEFLPRIQLLEQDPQQVGALGETVGSDIDLGAGLGL
jgi:uncharacterized membrane protein YjgN (DUF898 family)